MLKIGLVHAMLLDTVTPRRRRYSDALVLTLAPSGFGRQLIALMARLGVLDEAQRAYFERVRQGPPRA